MSTKMTKNTELRLPPVGELFEIIFPEDTEPCWESAQVMYRSATTIVLAIEGEEHSFEPAILKTKSKIRLLNLDKDSELASLRAECTLLHEKLNTQLQTLQQSQAKNAELESQLKDLRGDN